MPRRVRLTKKQEIGRVFRNATFRKMVGPLAITGVENDLTHPRLGLAIAKRFVPKAVNRNHVKRAVREWFRHNQAYLANVDLMVSVHQRMTDPRVVHTWLTMVASNIETKH